MNNTNPNHIQFTPSEKDFFLNCVGEIMKVWASKSGQAGMNISVQNGIANPQLNFQLGSPGDPHLSPQPHPFQKPPRFKTPARKAKDRARAAAHQQAQLLNTSCSKSADSQSPSILPTNPSSFFANPDLHKPAPLLQAAPAAHHHHLHNQAAPAFHDSLADSAAHQQIGAVTASPPAASVSTQTHSAPALILPAAASAAQLDAAPAVLEELQTGTQVPIQPLSTQIQNTQAAPASPPPPKTTIPIRNINLLYDRADRITMAYACNHKIAYSNCQGQIEDKFWTTLKEKPLEYLTQNQVDEDKIRETYKSTARSLGVRLY